MHQCGEKRMIGRSEICCQKVMWAVSPWKRVEMQVGDGMFKLCGLQLFRSDVKTAARQTL
jgi:hypothetical protein